MRPHISSILFVSLAIMASSISSGCSPSCGKYTSLTGLEMVVGEDVYDYDRDDMFETCGSDFGAFGDHDLDHFPEVGFLVLMPDHRNMEIDTHICPSLYYHVNFDNSSLVEGQELSIIDGEAGIHAVTAAQLTSGTIEVLKSREADAECEPFREQDWKLRWDLEFGSTHTGVYFTAEGEDWIGLTMPMSYGDEGC